MKTGLINQNKAAELLNLSPVTIQRWVYQGKIPYKKINEEIYFVEDELFEWAKLHDITIVKKNKAFETGAKENLLLTAVKKGGVFFDIEGNDVYSVLKNAIDKLNFINEEQKELVLNEILDREELTSTGIGNGIAIPHTRRRISLGLERSLVSVFFLKNSINYNSIDKKPVKVLFMLFTTDTKEHLNLLSKISYILQRKELTGAIINCDSEKKLMTILEQVE